MLDAYPLHSELASVRSLPKEVVAWELKADDAAAGRVQEKWSLVRVLTTPRLRLPLLLVVAMQGGQQMAGINAVRVHTYQIAQKNPVTSSGFVYVFVRCSTIRLKFLKRPD